jgi:DnaJ-class molecular chaperone
MNAHGCNGGMMMDDTDTDCPTCDGTGCVPIEGTVPDADGLWDRPCPACGGDGVGDD